MSSERGRRFAEDNDFIALYIERSKNKNLVVYQSAPRDVALADPSNAIDAYWLDIDPEYAAKRQAAGGTSDRVELSFLEKKMAYGHAVTVAATQTPLPGYHNESLSLTFVAVPGRAMELRWRLVDGLPVVVTSLQERPSTLEKVWVQSTEPQRFYQLPRVEYVDLFGVDLETGASVVERITQ